MKCNFEKVVKELVDWQFCSENIHGVDDILSIIESKVSKECEEYKIADKKYSNFLMKNPRIEDFLESGKIENITQEEIYKIFKLYNL